MIRLLHTADWHVGRRFNQWDLLDDQERFGDWLVELVAAERIDAVLVAGDLFDRAVAPAQAVELVDRTLARLLATGAAVVAVSGNHDSAQRLGFGARAMEQARLWIRTERRDCGALADPVVLRGRDGTALPVLAVPYLDPQRLDEAEGLARSHHGAVEHVVARAVAGGLAPERSVVMAHAFVAGGAPSDSERELVVGGTAEVALSAFAGAGYVALGHLHRPQELGGGRAAYAGSPLAYSFSEEHAKSVRIVESDGAGTFRCQTVRVDVGRSVRTLRGTLDEILGAPEHESARTAFVRVELSDPTHRLGAMEKVRQRYPFAAELAYTALDRQRGAGSELLAGPRRLQPRDVIGRYAEQAAGLEQDGLVAELVDAAYLRATSGEGGA